MKVLWYVNIVMPDAAAALGEKSMNTGGWLTGMLTELQKHKIDLVVCAVSELVKRKETVVVNGVKYYLLPKKSQPSKADFELIIREESPDVVHVFGTETDYNIEMISAAESSKTVIYFQGIMTEDAKHYRDGIPKTRLSPLRFIAKKLYYADDIEIERREFERLGKRELEVLKNAKHVIGRTDWDKNFAENVCVNAKYFNVNENLRPEFYAGERWSYMDCEKHSIFVSQGFYPIKGLHMALTALPKILEKHPDAKLYIAGPKPFSLNNAFLDVFVNYFCEYQRYIGKLIKKYALQDKIVFTGRLSPVEMKKMYLRCNVFLSSSTIENSPNSVGEAMMLGVPVVASNVGGTSSILKDGEEGLLYEFRDTEKLAELIDRLFIDNELAEKLGSAAHKRAVKTHDREANTQALLGVYAEIVRSKR